MSSKDLRKKIDEIAERRTRTPEGSALSNFTKRTHVILTAALDLYGLKEHGEVGWARLSDELARHFPVAAVAAMEAYFRQIAGELIDRGEPFTNRLEKLSQERVSLSFAAAVQNQRCTVGDFISHSLKVGGIHDIDKTMSALMDVEFLKTVARPTPQIPPGSKVMVPKGTEVAIPSIKWLFATRHLLCHEFAPRPNLDLAETAFHVLEAVNFVTVCQSVIDDLRDKAIASAR